MKTRLVEAAALLLLVAVSIAAYKLGWPTRADVTTATWRWIIRQF